MAICKYCRANLKAHRKDLVAHAQTAKHKTAVEKDSTAKSCRKLTSTFIPIHSEKNKIAELKLAAFIAEHASIQTIDHLTQLLPQLDSNSDILSKLKLHKTKCTMIIKNVLGPCMLDSLLQEVGNSAYSLIIDESTDVSTQKILCIMIRFFSVTQKKMVTTFYRLIKLTASDAQSVCNAISCQLKHDGLSLQNLVGIGVDGANVMVGKHNSVAAIFKREVQDLIVVKCICHSLHLCAEKAAESLPRQLEFLVREIHNWFAYSSKRIEEYKQLYETINNNRNNKKVPGLSGTRWLARFDAIHTILEQWVELELLFSIAKNQDKCYMANQLHEIIKILPYKAYLIFLRSELKSITQVNKLFQSNQVEPLKLFEDLFLLYKSLLQKIIVPAQLQKVNDSELANYDFHPYIMHTSSIYFGYDFESVAQALNKNDLTDVRERCKNFLVILAEQIQFRLPENLSVLKVIANLHPKTATAQVKPTLEKILGEISREVYGSKPDIEKEWQQLHNKKWNNLSNSEDFYAEVKEDTDAAGNKRFENVAKFATALLSLPFSNASVERAFSVYAAIKNKLRNRLSPEMLQCLMMVRYTLQRQGSCINFKPTPAMLTKFNYKMYDFKNNSEIENDSIVMEEILENISI